MASYRQKDIASYRQISSNTELKHKFVSDRTLIRP